MDKVVLPLSFGFSQFRGYADESGARNLWIAAKMERTIGPVTAREQTAINISRRRAPATTPREEEIRL